MANASCVTAGGLSVLGHGRRPLAATGMSRDSRHARFPLPPPLDAASALEPQSNGGIDSTASSCSSSTSASTS